MHRILPYCFSLLGFLLPFETGAVPFFLFLVWLGGMILFSLRQTAWKLFGIFHVGSWSVGLGLAFFHGLSPAILILLGLCDLLGFLSRGKSWKSFTQFGYFGLFFRLLLIVLAGLVPLEPLWSWTNVVEGFLLLAAAFFGALALAEQAWFWGRKKSLLVGFLGFTAALGLVFLAMIPFYFSPDRSLADQDFEHSPIDSALTADQGWQTQDLGIAPSPLGVQLELGPALGSPGADRIRIWAFSRTLKQASVQILDSHGNRVQKVPLTFLKENDGAGWVEITGLNPSTEYTYDLTDDSGLSLLPPKLKAACHFETFPADFEAAPLRFAFTSCHRPLAESSDYYSGQFLPERFVLWEALSRQIQTEKLHFLLLLGDQIYADEAFEASLKIWDQAEQKQLGEEEAFQKAKNTYIETYLRFWSHPSLRKVFASVGMYMMWDDHETRDGWETLPEDHEMKSHLWVGKAAAEVTKNFQSFAMDKKVAGLGGYRFQFGQNAFFIPDLRKTRDLSNKEYPFWGPEQAQDFQNWAQDVSKTSKNLFVGLEFPTAEAPIWAIDWLSQDRSGEQSSGLGDDFREKWLYSGARNDLVLLLDQLANWQTEDGHQAFILAGDVHIAGLGRHEDLRQPTGSRKRLIYQLIASGISNQDSLSQMVYTLFQKLGGRSYLFGTPYTAMPLKSLGEMNYGYLTIDPREKEDAVTYLVASNGPRAPQNVEFLRFLDTTVQEGAEKPKSIWKSFQNQP